MKAVELIQLLQSILEAQHSNRAKLVIEFQHKVWNEENLPDKKLNELLSGLAYDLDFYESNEEWRKESPNYFGDEKLENLIKSEIDKIKALVLK
jgi:hypothetical protein